MPMSTRTYRIIIAFGALLLALGASPLAGCQAELDGILGTEKPGLDPPLDRFFFPTGMALSPDGRYLFVSNGNSDLKYNGGTVVVVDMVEAIDRLDALWSPDATDVDRPQDLLDRVAATCRYAPQNPQLVECHEEDVGQTPGLVMSDLTVRTGFYPSFLALEQVTPDSCFSPQPAPGEDKLLYRLYTPVRGDPSLTFIDISATADSSEVTCMDCGEGCETTDIRDCKSDYRLNAPSAARQVYVDDTLPAEPFAMALEPAGGFLILAHLAGGSLSLVDLCGDPTSERPDLVDVLVGVMGQDADGRSGGFNVVQRDKTDPCGWFYVSNRAAAQLMTLRVDGCNEPAGADRGLRLVMGPSIILTAPFGPLESGADLRGMATSADGNRLFALSRTPPSLLVVDTSLSNGQPRNEFLDAVEICPKPSVMRLRTGPQGRTLAYTVCFASGEIYVVDTHDAQVVDRIEAGGGPHDLVLMPDTASPELRGFGLVTNFGEHTVGVLDLRPDSETYHQLIGRLGWPEELMQ
jgi:hypothetical protein